MKKLNFIFPQFIADLQMSPESYSDSVHCCYRTPTEVQAWFLKAQCVIYQRDMLKIGHRYIRWRNILVFNSVEITAKTKAHAAAVTSITLTSMDCLQLDDSKSEVIVMAASDPSERTHSHNLSPSLNMRNLFHLFFSFCLYVKQFLSWRISFTLRRR